MTQEYHTTFTCVGYNDNEKYETGTIHDCWTNDDCSIKATFFEHAPFYQQLLISSIVFLCIAGIFIPLCIYFGWKVYRNDSKQFWNILAKIWFWPIFFPPGAIYISCISMCPCCNFWDEHHFYGGPKPPKLDSY